MLISITRNEQAFIPTTGTVFQDGDGLKIVITSSSMDRLEEMLGFERR